MSIKRILLSLFGKGADRAGGSAEVGGGVSEAGGEIQYTRELVLKKAGETFPSGDTATVMRALDGYGGTSPGRERVQLAILKLSEGELERLAEYVNVAKVDYRDVLAYAEYPLEMKSQAWEMEADAVAEVRRRDREQYLEWLNGGAA